MTGASMAVAMAARDHHMVADDRASERPAHSAGARVQRADTIPVVVPSRDHYIAAQDRVPDSPVDMHRAEDDGYSSDATECGELTPGDVTTDGAWYAELLYALFDVVF